jgi:DNA-binding CsgD family transcriptional regulator/PAS domain-containing protein
MALPLSTADLARLESASRAFLSPLAYETVTDWRAGVMEAACAAVGAASATFNFPGQDAFTRLHGLDDRVAEAAGVFLRNVWSGTGGSPDPTLEPFHRFLIRERVEVWDMPMAFHVLGVDPHRDINPWRGEVLIPDGMDDTNSLFVATPRGSVHLSLHGFRRRPEAGALFPVLRLLVPSFKAGLDALDRLGAHRAALDAAGEPLAVFDADAAETHRTPALVALLAADPEAGAVGAGLSAFARRLRPLVFSRRADAADAAVPTATVQTARAAYALRAVLLGAGAAGLGDAFVVTVEPRGLATAFPSPAAVREAFGLTRREAEVALLVAEGLANDAIADRLFVSPHTVRHHVEAAMAKLELTGRGREAVAARLLGAKVA